MSTSDPRPIWYLAHPKHQYVEDVQQIAIDNGWRILDIKYDAGDGVTGPAVTIDPAYTAAYTNPPAPIGYGDIADPGSPDLTAIQSQITTLNSKAASDETRLDTLEAGGGGGTDTVARAAATQAQTEVDAAEVALAQAVARLDALEALPPAEVDQAELDQAVADAAAARTALANAQATADAAQDTSLADHVSDTDKHTTAAEKADFHKPLTLSTALAAAGATISATQELDLPAAAAPETKDTTPTAGSTVAVTSEGIKTALDLKADQTALDVQELKQNTHETDADVHVTPAQKADFHKPLTLKTGSAGTLTDQELDIPLPVPLTQAQLNDRTNTTNSTIEGGKAMFDHEQAVKGVAADWPATAPDYDIGKPQSSENIAGLMDSRWLQYLRAQGWQVNGGALSRGTPTDTFDVAAGDYIRINALGVQEPYPVAAQPSASFLYVTPAGLVTLGHDGVADFSGAQTAINTDVGYWNGTALASIKDFNTDVNDGVNWRVYINPVDGQVYVSVPQQVHNTVAVALDRVEAAVYEEPAFLSGMWYLGFVTKDEDATAISFVSSTSGSGSSAPAQEGEGWLYRTNPADLDALTNADLVDGLAVGAGLGDTFVLYRVISAGADWATSTKELVYSVGQLSDFTDTTRKSIAQDWKAETLDDQFLSKPMPLPATGATLEVNKRYFGRQGNYTLPDGVDGDFFFHDNPSNLKGEATVPVFTGRYSFGSDGTIYEGALSPSPNGVWRLYWDSTLAPDPDTGVPRGAWRIHSNRSLTVPLDFTDDGTPLSRGAKYNLVNSSAGPMTVYSPKVPGADITIRYNKVSTHDLVIEQEDGTSAELLWNGVVNFRHTIPVKYAGALITLERTIAGGNTYWQINGVDEDEVRDLWEAGDVGNDGEVKYAAGARVVAIAPGGVFEGKPRIYQADSDRPNTITTFDATEALEWTDKGGAPLIEHTAIYPIIPLSGSSVDGLNRKANVPVFFTSIGSDSNVSLKLFCNTSGSKTVEVDGQPVAKTGDLTTVEFDGSGYLIAVSRTYEDPAATSGVTRIELIKKPGAAQEVLPDWAGDQTYTVAETKVVGIAPIGVAPQVEGTAYILRPKADLTSATDLDATEWALYDVLGEYKLNGTTVRSVTDTGVESLLFFDINAGTEGNIRVIPKDVTKTFRLSGIVDANFALDDNTVGQVTATGGTSQDVTVTGPATLYHTLDGTTHKISVFGTIVPVQRKELSTIGFGLHDPANGIFLLDGSTYTSAALAADPLAIAMGFTIVGDQVTVPDARSKVLYGADDRTGSGNTHVGAMGATVIQALQSHNHLSGAVTFNATGAFYGTSAGGSSKGVSNWDGFSGTQTPRTSTVGSTKNRVDGLTAPIVFILGETRQYVPAEEVIEVEDSEIVLIDLEPSNNQVCAFSTGENWAEIKANYENLRFDFNISDSGRDLIVPHTITITPAMLEQMLPVSGFSLFNDQGVKIDLNTLSNADRSFVYTQSSGDSPTGGRMQFKVVGLKKTKNIVGIPVTNPDVAAGTYQIRKNADGTFELI